MEGQSCSLPATCSQACKAHGMEGSNNVWVLQQGNKLQRGCGPNQLPLDPRCPQPVWPLTSFLLPGESQAAWCHRLCYLSANRSVQQHAPAWHHMIINFVNFGEHSMAPDETTRPLVVHVSRSELARTYYNGGCNSIITSLEGSD